MAMAHGPLVSHAWSHACPAVSNALIACVAFPYCFSYCSTPRSRRPWIACLYPHPSAQIQLSSFQGLAFGGLGARAIWTSVPTSAYVPPVICGLLRREVQRAAVSPRHANFACLKRPRETALLIVQILLRHGLGAEQALGPTGTHTATQALCIIDTHTYTRFAPRSRSLHMCCSQLRI